MLILWYFQQDYDGSHAKLIGTGTREVLEKKKRDELINKTQEDLKKNRESIDARNKCVDIFIQDNINNIRYSEYSPKRIVDETNRRWRDRRIAQLSLLCSALSDRNSKYYKEYLEKNFFCDNIKEWPVMPPYVGTPDIEYNDDNLIIEEVEELK